MKLRYIKRAGAYTYFRDRQGRTTALPGKIGSPEFKRAYQICLDAMLGSSSAPPVRIGDAKDTLAAAITVYLDSSHFAGLADSTRKRLARECEAMRTAPIGRGRLRDMDVHTVNRYTEGLAKKHGTSVADRHGHLLSSIWDAAIDHPQFDIARVAKPTLIARSHYKVQREHRPWPAELQARFMATAPDNLKLAKTLLHFSVQRGGDCCAMKWADYVEGQDGKKFLLVRPQKTHGERKAEPSYHQVPDVLVEALDAAPRTCETILVNGDGQPFANAAVLSKAIKRHLIRIGAAKKGERSFVMHGLRKTGALDVVLAGGGVPELKAVGNWASDSQALYYVRGFDRRRANANAVDLWNAKIKEQVAQRQHELEVADRRAKIKAVA